MNNKKIVVGIVLAFVVLACIAVGIGIMLGDGGSKNSGARYGEGADGFKAGFDEKKHIGVAKVVTQQQVESVLGKLGSDVKDVSASGTVTLGNTLSETATFNFTTSKSKDNSFSVDARTYPSADELKKADPFKGADVEKVAGVGDEAHYSVAPFQPYLKNKEQTLIVTKDKTSYHFILSQPDGKEAINSMVARNMLLQVAKEAKLNEVK